jgi:hypothetical protein
VTAAAARTALTLLIRPGCGLCDDFVEAFAAELPELFAQLAMADVDERAEWRKRFGLKIPVLLDPTGEAICETFLDTAKVRSRFVQHDPAA